MHLSWSEFLPLAIFIIVIVWMLEDWTSVVHAPLLDRVFILIACAGCLVLRPAVSGLAHVFYQQSRRNYLVWWAADYVSICFAITCSSLLFARFILLLCSLLFLLFSPIHGLHYNDFLYQRPSQNMSFYFW